MAFDPSILVSLAFLFGIAAQFRAADGNEFLRSLLSSLEGRVGILYGVIAVTALFSPFVLNDVLVLILTPVVISYSKETGADIAPLLVGEITFTNLASSLTPLGNPQNILLWQSTGVSFGAFVEGAWLKVAASGLIAAALLFPFRGKSVPARSAMRAANSWRPAAYLAGAAGIAFAANIVGVPSVVALGLAFGLGFAFTSRSLGKVAKEFDLRALLTLYALVLAIETVATLVRPSLYPYVSTAATGAEPYTAGFFAAVSAVISNVPATQLVLSTTTVHPNAAAGLAVASGLAGNIDPISSFANLLALLMVRRSGLSVRKAVVLQLVVGLFAFVPAAL